MIKVRLRLLKEKRYSIACSNLQESTSDKKEDSFFFTQSTSKKNTKEC